MMELTREQAITEHRKMWNWIADEIESYKTTINIYKYKIKYCILNKNEYTSEIVKYHYSCFLCYYTGNECSICPLIWNSEASEFMCELIKDDDDKGNGLLEKCVRAETWQEQAALARQIANLPERTDV